MPKDIITKLGLRKEYDNWLNSLKKINISGLETVYIRDYSTNRLLKTKIVERKGKKVKIIHPASGILHYSSGDINYMIIDVDDLVWIV